MERKSGCLLGAAAVLLLAGYSQAIDWPSMPYTLHSNCQAVDGDGFGTFPVNSPIKMRGVLLNWGHSMLDPTPGAPEFLGGLWQRYVQTVEPGDFGGTACWMGQYIGKIVGNHPAGSYTDQEWVAELDRLDYDPATGHHFRPGDLVEVRARAPGLHFRGKTNINEQHANVPEADFDLVLLQADYGLPAAEVITLSEVKDAGDGFIFDQTRATGAEHYQGLLVQINNVSFVNPGDWGPNAGLTVQDGTGRTLPVLLGLGSGFTLYDPPPAPFDIIGIFDQEDYNPDDGYKDGYRLWVMDYDGSQFVVDDTVHPVLLSAASRKEHCGVGNLDIDLPLAAAEPGIETRQDGLTTVVLTFSEIVEATDGTPDATEVSVSVGDVDSVQINAKEMIVELSGIPDESCVDLTVTGLEDLAENALVGDNDVRIKVLLGDVNGDNYTDLIDMAYLKHMHGEALDETTARFDLNLDGQIDLIDMALAKSRNGHAVACP